MRWINFYFGLDFKYFSLVTVGMSTLGFKLSAYMIGVSYDEHNTGYSFSCFWVFIYLLSRLSYCCLHLWTFTMLVCLMQVCLGEHQGAMPTKCMLYSRLRMYTVRLLAINASPLYAHHQMQDFQLKKHQKSFDSRAAPGPASRPRTTGPVAAKKEEQGRRGSKGRVRDI